ncbi:hypothetical protein GTA08_BOTSDO04395 [Neofusicoccum parvum]|nr:hypothetical protein GTA08_BOTSDO04395 [Neofusicoccum parvum]
MRIDTPSPHPRLLLEPHLTYALPPAVPPTTITALHAHYRSAVLTRHTRAPSPSTPTRLAARAHRAANPIPLRATRSAFSASIAGPTAPVALPTSFVDTAANLLQQADVEELRRAAVPPLFVYGQWMFPAQMAAALGRAGAVAGAPRMVPARLGGWNRYCVRGRAPTAGVVEHGCERVRYYVRDVVEQEGVEGRLVVGVTGEEWERLDRLVGVGEERVFGKREVEVGVRVEGTDGVVRVKAGVYVWEGDPLDLHIFKEDKVWTPELYVDWHYRTRREMAEAEGEAQQDTKYRGMAS